ncbi:MAG TPA: protein kinase [Kofleriaceae bacterium]|nr:protein kinase [Kofleriaceae bacterium]
MCPDDDDLGSAKTAIGGTMPSQPGVSRVVAEPVTSVIADRYEVQALLGMGGMGRVYRALDRTLDDVVALKMLRRELLDTPGVLERFRQEVKLARRVTHANVVRTFDLGQHGQDHYLTMEYIEGRSLAQLIDDGPLAFDEIMRIARAVAAGIAAAHANGVLHRDLKPDNVLIAKTGRIAITDFGIATASTSPTVTSDRLVGTPAYMAPEQLEEGATIAAPADVYAFGTILFEMATGRRPFVGNDPIQVALARLHTPPPDPRTLRQVPEGLAELCIACMGRRPETRPADGSGLVAALASLSDLSSRPRTGRLAMDTPTRTSRSVAILPLRGTGDLGDVAEGLSEEIVDALSMTRSLRVRPLASVRKAVRADSDARDVGQQLGVDVVVEGSVRRRGDHVRITARMVSVADGFQLWASHIDTGTDGLLAASDDLVEAIAKALTVDLAMPDRVMVDPEASSLYLEGKAKVRLNWIDGNMEPAIESLQQALELAPNDPAILATLSQALARSAFYGAPASRIAQARELAERAVELAPRMGVPHIAVGTASLYDGDAPASVAAFARALQHSPGSAMAQAMLGAALLEAGALDDAIARLEVSRSLDPLGLAHIDLPRAYFYAGRWDDTVAEYERARVAKDFDLRLFDDIMFARLKLWRGELAPIAEVPGTSTPPNVFAYAEVVRRIHATGVFSAADRAAMAAIVDIDNRRLRASRAQFMAEYLMFAGEPDEALRYVRIGVEAGLQDYLWAQKCPLLAPLRARAEFQALEATVAERSRAVIAASRAA